MKINHCGWRGDSPCSCELESSPKWLLWSLWCTLTLRWSTSQRNSPMTSGRSVSYPWLTSLWFICCFFSPSAAGLRRFVGRTWLCSCRRGLWCCWLWCWCWCYWRDFRREKAYRWIRRSCSWSIRNTIGSISLGLDYERCCLFKESCLALLSLAFIFAFAQSW